MDGVQRITYFVLLPIVVAVYALIAWNLGDPLWVFNR